MWRLSKRAVKALGVFILKSIASIGICGALAACGSEKNPSNPPEVLNERVLPSRPEIANLPDFVDPLYEVTTSACQRLKELSLEAGRGRFSLFQALHHEKNEIQGRVALEQSPFVQMYLAEKFKIPSNAEFLESVQKQRERQELGFFGFWGVKSASLSDWALTRLKIWSVHSELEQGFPGLFGEEGPAEKSLWMSLARKSAGGFASVTSGELSMLTLPAALLPADLRFLSEDMRISLGSALRGWNAVTRTGAPALYERFCSLSLWQRAWAQMLTIKGYDQPDFAPTAKGRVARRLEVGRESFGRSALGGYMYDATRGRPVTFSSEDFKSYDPARRFVTLTAAPSGASEVLSTPLGVSLSILDAMVSVYIATSPNETGLPLGRYPVGEIFQNNNAAVLPFEAHSWALGFISLLYKNLVYENILPVGSGSRRAESKKSNGILLVENRAGDQIVRLDDILKLLRSGLRMDSALASLLAEPSDKWMHAHPIYDSDTLSAVREMRVSLQKLHRPLADLAQEMVGPGLRESCVSEMIWVEVTNEKQKLASCSDAQLETFQQILRELGMVTKTPYGYGSF